MNFPEVVHPMNEIDFCSDMETARANFKTGAAIYANALLPADESPGYAEFIIEVVVPLLTTVTTGTEAEQQMSPKRLITVFFKCYLIAAGYGMQDYSSNQRKALDCFVQHLMMNNSAEHASYAVYDLLLDFKHDHEEATAAHP